MPRLSRAVPPARSMHARLFATAAVLLPLAGVVLLQEPSKAASESRLLPSPTMDSKPTAGGAHGSETAVLAGGCFWGVQGVFQHVRGVQHVVAGYSGGIADTANYEMVSDGATGQAEAVRITYDPALISYGQILRIFFSVTLDPTEVNRQGPDTGTQYRSEIFYATPEQEQVAHAYVAQLDRAHVFPRPIATRVDPLTGFYPAEAYHQDYLVRHPDNPYIAINDLPKVNDLRRLFPDSYAARPVLALPPASGT
jgi:peptide-methionine (S)-S-oxide reductase